MKTNTAVSFSTQKKTCYVPGKPDFEISEWVYDDMTNIAFHNHSGNMEIFVVTRGYGYHYVNSQICEISRGDVFFIDKNSFHSICPMDTDNSTRLTVINYVFSRKFFSSLEPVSPQLKEALDFIDTIDPVHSLYQEKNANLIRNAPFAESALMNMYKSHQEDYAMQEEAIRFLLSVIIIKFHDLFLHRQLKKTHNITNSIVVHSIQYMQDNLRNPDLSLDTLYNNVFVSKSYFTALFKQETGLTPIRYLNRLRIQLACDLLHNSNEDIQNLYLEVGFNNHNNFYINFKKFTGFSLRSYVKVIKIRNTMNP